MFTVIVQRSQTLFKANKLLLAIFGDVEKYLWVRNKFPFYWFVADREIISTFI